MRLGDTCGENLVVESNGSVWTPDSRVRMWTELSPLAAAISVTIDHSVRREESGYSE